MLPYVLFKLPIIGDLLHDIRGTGFDQSGTVRLAMSREDRQSKWRREQGIDDAADHLKALPSTAIGVVDGVIAETEGVVGAISDAGRAGWDVARDGTLNVTLNAPAKGLELMDAGIGAVVRFGDSSVGAVARLGGSFVEAFSDHAQDRSKAKQPEQGHIKSTETAAGAESLV